MNSIGTGIPPGKTNGIKRELSNLNIEGNRVISRQRHKTLFQLKPSAMHLKKIASSFILFDWEFFSNELEYE